MLTHTQIWGNGETCAFFGLFKVRKMVNGALPVLQQCYHTYKNVATCTVPLTASLLPYSLAPTVKVRVQNVTWGSRKSVTDSVHVALVYQGEVSDT